MVSFAGYLPDLIVQAFYVGSEWALIAVGFGLIARTCGIFHLAIGSLFGVGAYCLYLGVAQAGFGRIPAVLLAMVVTALVSAAVDRVVYQPVTGLQGQRQFNHLAPFVASLGVMIVLRTLLQILFGASPLAVEPPALGVAAFAGARVLTWNLWRAGIAVAAILLFAAWLRGTRAGLSLTALAQSAEGASVIGISERGVRLQLFLATGALAGLAGALSMMTHPIMPGDGFAVMLYGSLVALLFPGAGPIGWWLGSVAAALIYGIGVILVGNGWEDTILQATLLACIVVTRVLLPRLRRRLSLRHRAYAAPRPTLAEGEA